MKRLTKEQINEIKELRKSGKTIVELCKMFNVNKFVIMWHTNQDFRNRFNDYQNRRYHNLTKEQKKEYFEKRRDYQREYHKRRYKADPEFRNKQLKQTKKYQESKKN